MRLAALMVIAFLTLMPALVSAAAFDIVTKPTSGSVVGTSITLGFYVNTGANLTMTVTNSTTTVYSENATGATNMANRPVTVPEGTVTITFTATDGSGTVTNESTGVIVDATSPQVSINFPTNSNKQTVASGQGFNVNYTYTETNPSEAFIEIFDTSNNQIKNVTVPLSVGGTVTRVDGIAFPTGQSGGSFHTRVTIKDKANQTTADTEQNSLVFDTTAPSLTFSGPTNNSKEYIKGSTDFDVLFKFTESNPQNVTIKLLHENGTAIVTSVYTPAGGTDVSEQRRISVPSAVPDGLYDINITVYDQAGQKANSLVNDAVVIDNTAPNITTFNLSSIVVNVGEAIAATCQATDNSQAWGGSINTSVQNIDTSRAKTGTALCSAVDMAGNDAWATMRYTVLEIGANATNATTNDTNITSNVTTNQTNVTDNVSVVVEQNTTNTTNETNASTTVTTPEPTPLTPTPNATTTPQPAPTPQPAAVEAEADASGMSALLWGAIGIVVLGIVFGVMYAIGRGGGPSGGEKPSAPEQYQGPSDYVPSGQKVKLSELVKKPKEGNESSQ